MQSLFSWTASTNVKVETGRWDYFPAVTICNNNPIAMDWYTASKTGSGSTYYQSKKSESTSDSTTQSSSSSSSSSSGDTMYCLQNLYETMSLVHIVEGEGNAWKSGHALCDVVMTCAFNGVDCSDISSVFWESHFNPYYGNCWTFNAGKQLTNDEAKKQPLWDAKKGDVLKSKEIGKYHGLKLMLNTNLHQYLPFTPAYGWRVLVHNQTTRPFPQNEGVDIHPGTSTQIQIKKNYVSKLNSVDNCRSKIAQ